MASLLQDRPVTVLRIVVAWVARSPARAFILIFLLGLSIRVADLTTISARRILPNDRMEDTAIATALVERGEFADPYIIPTGLTAHLPPLVPGIHAFFWRVFGMGLAGGVAAYLFSIVALSALYALAPWLGEKLGIGREPGVLAGIVGSFIVLRFGNAEEATGLVLALLAVVFLRRWTTGQLSARGSFTLGLACGIAFHLQPVLLLVVLGWMVFDRVSPAQIRARRPGPSFRDDDSASYEAAGCRRSPVRGADGTPWLHT